MKTHPATDRLYLKQWFSVAGTYLLASMLVAVTVTQAAGYIFTPVADSTGAFMDFGPAPAPSLNASGTVAFYASSDNGNVGIYKGNGAIITTIFTTSQFPTSFSNPSINQAGTVAFFLSHGGNSASIVTGNGGPLVTIADTTGQFKDVYNNPSINLAGTVAFSGALKTGGGGIFVSNGGVTTQVVASAFNSTINDVGAVSFQGYQNGHTAIAASSGGSATVIADDSGPLKVFGYNPAINNAGAVTFVAGLSDQDSGAYGIYSGNGGLLTTIADLAGPFSFFSLYYTQPSINGAGTVAFFAGLDAGGSGIFTGNGVTTNEIIGTGDTLFGSTVSGLLISPTAFNDSGQLAFYYQLANGTEGIALATPTPGHPRPCCWPLPLVCAGRGVLGGPGNSGDFTLLAGRRNFFRQQRSDDLDREWDRAGNSGMASPFAAASARLCRGIGVRRQILTANEYWKRGFVSEHLPAASSPSDREVRTCTA